MIIMALDFGKARTGLAVCDSGETLAFPRGVITEYNSDKLAQKIAAEAKNNSAQLIVAGVPVNMDGSSGFRAAECREQAELVSKYSNLPVIMWDERCTTQAAYTVLNASGTYGKKRKQNIDAVAAVMILESYLAYRAGHPEEKENPCGSNRRRK